MNHAACEHGFMLHAECTYQILRSSGEVSIQRSTLLSPNIKKPRAVIGSGRLCCSVAVVRGGVEPPTFRFSVFDVAARTPCGHENRGWLPADVESAWCLVEAGFQSDA
ncbi:hypothetical protein ACSDR0_36240, partial [Streptosporangium sp. G11]|uniref:hypothetical protein n=1 Tax=Streptosporangium sp. G11 TaxID=3436926 RepID=UPI003EBAB00E